MDAEGTRIYNGRQRPLYTPHGISELDEDEVFVFGSTPAGLHADGAARYALRHYGARVGKGSGFSGQSYAIPVPMCGYRGMAGYVDEFIRFAEGHPELFFYVIRIGCGLAAYRDREIAPMFKEAASLDNVCLPEGFMKVIRKKWGQRQR